MQNPIKASVICGCAAAVVLVSGCSPQHEPPMTVAEFMEDRVALDGVLMKCDEQSSRARSAVECSNARIAIQRLASEHEPADAAKHAADFERAREQIRSTQDRRRLEQQSKSPAVDAYHLPLVPMEPPVPPVPPVTAPP